MIACLAKCDMHAHSLNTIVSPTSYDPPPDSGLDLRYCDESLLVVNKPAGLLSVPGRGADKNDSLLTRIHQEFPEALCVHRLDMSTSGLLVFARDADMHQRLSRLFRERGVKKFYIAIVSGRVEDATGEIDLPLGADWPNRPRQKVDISVGKPSLTRFRLLEYIKRPIGTAPHQALTDSRLELEPVTGRTHQLRVHMASIRHPILGDALYGDDTDVGTERLLLHASGLNFVHPSLNETLSLICEPPF